MISITAYLRKMAQFFDMDPEMLLKLLQDYLGNVGDDWNYVLPTELHGLLKEDKNPYFLVDLRKPEDYAKGYISGAINIFWLDILKPENLKRLPVDREILLYCYLGHTSSQVLVILSLLGYRCKSLKFGEGVKIKEHIDSISYGSLRCPL